MKAKQLPNTTVYVKQTTKDKVNELVTYFADKYPDYKVNQDYVIRLLLQKYEGDLQ
jgi:hypothetical protein